LFDVNAVSGWRSTGNCTIWKVFERRNASTRVREMAESSRSWTAIGR
jgi:hypothetical protein